MEESKFKQLVDKFRGDYEQFKEIILLDQVGSIIFKSEEFPIDENETKELLDSWKNTKGSLTFMGTRYVILKWDDIQLAAKNIKGSDNICGSITPDGDYFVARIDDEEGMLLLIEWSIMINKVIWEN